MTEIYIPLPEGLKLPQGAEDGGSFDVSCNVKVEDGQLCVKKINGIPLPGAGMEKESMEPKMDMMDAARKDGYA